MSARTYDVEVAKRLYLEGRTATDVAAMLGVSVRSVLGVLHAAHIPVAQQIPLTGKPAAMKARAVAAYLEGDELGSEIAERYNVSLRTLWRWVAAAGKSYCRQRKPSPEMRHEAVRFYRKNKDVSIAYVARKFGASEKTVRDWLIAAGVPTRRIRPGWKWRQLYFDRSQRERAERKVAA